MNTECKKFLRKHRCLAKSLVCMQKSFLCGNLTQDELCVTQIIKIIERKSKGELKHTHLCVCASTSMHICVSQNIYIY